MDELATFPTGNYDDVVDSTTQALNYLRQPVGTPFILPGSMTTYTDDDKEMLWDKVMRGYPLTEAEIARL